MCDTVNRLFMLKLVYFLLLLILVCCNPRRLTSNLDSEKLIAERPKYEFYEVTTKSGLNLREGPSTDTLVLVTIPYKYRGTVSTVAPKIELIQKANGFWFQTSYKQKTGWLFSGFAKFLTQNEFLHPNSSERESSEFFRKSDGQVLRLEHRDVTDLIFAQNESIIPVSEAKIAKKFRTDKYEIYDFGLDTTPGSHAYSNCAGLVSYNVFKPLNTGKTFVDPWAQNASIQPRISADFAVGYLEENLCSCGRDVRYIVYILRDVPSKVSFPKWSLKPTCNPEEHDSRVTELSFDESEKRIYYQYTSYKCKAQRPISPKLEKFYVIDFAEGEAKVQQLKVDDMEALDRAAKATRIDSTYEYYRPYY